VKRVCTCSIPKSRPLQSKRGQRSPVLPLPQSLTTDHDDYPVPWPPTSIAQLVPFSIWLVRRVPCFQLAAFSSSLTRTSHLATSFAFLSTSRISAFNWLLTSRSVTRPLHRNASPTKRRSQDIPPSTLLRHQHHRRPHTKTTQPTLLLFDPASRYETTALRIHSQRNSSRPNRRLISTSSPHPCREPFAKS
jgi:hypothetical protein